MYLSSLPTHYKLRQLPYKKGLKLAMDLNLFPLEVESDATEAVKPLTLVSNVTNPTVHRSLLQVVNALREGNSHQA